MEIDHTAQLRQDLQRRLDAGGFPSLLARLSRPLSRPVGRLLVNREAMPGWGAALFGVLVTLGAGAVVAWAFGEEAYFGAGLIDMVITASLGACSALAAHALTQLFLRVLRGDLLPALRREEDLRLVERFLEQTFSLSRQVRFVLLVGPVLWGVLFWTFPAVSAHLLGGWGGRLVSLVASFQGAMALYYLAPLLDFLPRLGLMEMDLFGPNPRVSPVILNLQRAAVRAVYIFAALFVLMNLSIARLNTTDDRAVQVMVLFVTWVPLGVVFLGAQVTFRQLIARAKVRELARIQAQILTLSTREAPLTADTLAHMELLTTYHDRVFSAPAGAVDLRAALNFLNALFLPLLASVLSNLDVFTGLLDKLRGGP